MASKKNNTVIYFIIFITAAMMAAAVIGSAFYIRHQNDENYKNALKHMEEKDFGAAVLLFGKCGQYKDAEEMKEKAEKGMQYKAGLACIGNGEFQKGIGLIQDSGYQHNEDIIKKAHYLSGMDLYEQGKYQEASLQFNYAEDYKYAAVYDIACSYKSAGTGNKILYTAGKIYYRKHNYKDALACFIATEGYKNTRKWRKMAEREYLKMK